MRLKLLKYDKRFACIGSALVELTITIPVAVLVVLGTVHIGAVLREANIVVEAARHGARSTGAASGMNTEMTEGAVTWAGETISETGLCNASFSNLGNEIARAGACNYLTASGLNANEWRITSRVGGFSEGEAPADSVFVRIVSVTVAAETARGPVDSFKALLGLRPSSTSVFPLEVR